MIKTGMKISILFLGVIAVITAYGWSVIPSDAQVPIHFNAAGIADGWSGKMMALLLMPGMAVMLTGLLLFLPKIAPFRENLLQSKQLYLWIWGICLAMIAYIQALTVYVAVQNLPSLPSWSMKGLAAAIAILFLVTGNYLGKTRRNFFLGIRTPWTLSSDLSWEKTHRLVGRVWLITGALSLISILFVDAAKTMNGLMIIVFISAVLGVIYSYWIWKSDPHKNDKFDVAN